MGSFSCQPKRSPKLLASLGCAFALLLPAAPAGAHLRIDIDKATQRMVIVVDGVRRHSWPISTGRPGQETPNGRFRPLTMVRKEVSRTYDNAPMPYAIYFTNQGHAIHGTKAGVGGPASHGCVRIGLKHAAALYAMVKHHGRKKTLIRIVGQEAETVVSLRRSFDRGYFVEDD